MCLDRIEEKLDHEEYKLPEVFAEDMRLVFSNACLYNAEEHNIFKMAKSLEQAFEEMFAAGHEGNNWGFPWANAPPLPFVKVCADHMAFAIFSFSCDFAGN